MNRRGFLAVISLGAAAIVPDASALTVAAAVDTAVNVLDTKRMKKIGDEKVFCQRN
jgi:hypothetical protein